MKMLLAILKFMDKLVMYILKAITIVSFVLITLIVAASIVGRYIHISFLWPEEVIEILFTYLVFYGAAALWISKGHFSAGDWICRKILKKEASRHSYRLILEFAVLTFMSLKPLAFFKAALRGGFSLAEQKTKKLIVATGSF